MGQGTVNACEGYKMATSKFLPSLVHFVRGFAAWAFRVPFIAYKLVPCVPRFFGSARQGLVFAAFFRGLPLLFSH